MEKLFDRKTFIKSLAAAGAGIGMMGKPAFAGRREQAEPATIGIIGLDTSHSPAFTRLINNSDELSGFKVTSAYPYGSRTLEASYIRIPGYIEEMKGLGIEIVDSIDELLGMVDYILLETNDGNPRLEQALQVMEAGKTMFIDKPVAASLKDTIAIIEASEQYNAPFFSTSSLRYMKEAQSVRHENRIGNVLGADVYSPASIQESHPDLFWYGIHGVEILYTVMGTGCTTVSRTKNDDMEVVVGTWDDDRLGTFRGIRTGRSGFGGTAFGEEEILPMSTYEGYGPLVNDILDFFRTSVIPVPLEETLEIYAFMEAADESKRQGGAPVTLEQVISEARA